MFLQSPPKLEFVCQPEDHGVIAEPQPAKSVLPDWFRKLPPVDKNHLSKSNNGLTIKRCMPFIDAMTTGWILPLAASVRIEIRDNGCTLDAGWEFDKVMVSNHGPHQIAGHPKQPRPPCKFHNYWTIKTPPGWSCLFVPPLNRTNDVFECISGVVDTDTYTSLIHFPFIAHAPDGVYDIEKGTPLVQVIPFRRQDAAVRTVIRKETQEDADSRVRILRNTLAGDGWYRKHARGSR
jgi:hypothetical protein